MPFRRCPRRSIFRIDWGDFLAPPGRLREVAKPEIAAASCSWRQAIRFI